MNSEGGREPLFFPVNEIGELYLETSLYSLFREPSNPGRNALAPVGSRRDLLKKLLSRAEQGKTLLVIKTRDTARGTPLLPVTFGSTEN